MTIIAGVYALLGAVLGRNFNDVGNLLAILVVTGFVVAMFQPLRNRAQRLMSQWVFGQQREPYQVMSDLSQRLIEQSEPGVVFDTVASTLAHALHAPAVRIVLAQRDGDATVLRIAAAFPPTQAAAALPSDPANLTLGLRYQDRVLGELQVAPRDPGESYSAGDVALVRDVAASLSLAAHNALLQAELQRSRDRAVTALEDERRRLRRDLHDGLGPTLASLTLNLDAVKSWLATLRQSESRAAQPEVLLDTVYTLVDETRDIAGTAMHDVRRAINNLRPTQLDELGLIGALERHSERVNADAGAGATGARAPRIHIRVNGVLPALPAALEVAAFRITMEALTNVIRHAGATQCDVTLGVVPCADAAGAELLIQVQDDGIGMPASAQPGVGIGAMRDRATELGGTLALRSDGSGTCVEAHLPLNAVHKNSTGGA
jgi:signal transduction histidine kinase